jgi:hypothetical protein
LDMPTAVRFRAAAIWRLCRYTEWFSELGYVPIAIVASWSLLAVRGVPMTHDGLGLVLIEAYRRAYRGGDWFAT